MKAINRPCSVANLDPANENIPYEAAFDVRELVNVDEVMEREELGPNGGILWAMEELEANLDWLEVKLAYCGAYLLFHGSEEDRFANCVTLLDETIVLDPPGQAELMTHHMAFPHILQRLEKLGYRVCPLSETSFQRRR